MSSNDPDRDRKSSNSQNKTENPFIRFKHFADAQIGAVLQGIIGLPSVFSKPPNNANTRWAEVNNDLRRRERRQAEQQLHESDMGTGGGAGAGAGDEEEMEIPVRKFQDWMPASSPPREFSSAPGEIEKGSDRVTIDLFMPVTKALFAHLLRNPRDDVEWTPRRHDTILAAFDPNYCRHAEIRHFPKDFGERKSGNMLRMIQSLVFDDLNDTATSVNCQRFHSQYSILPYLLFSPYSPLALSSLPPLRKSEGLVSSRLNDFPYSAAFEDLLLASQGRPMTVHMPIHPACRPAFEESYEFDRAEGEMNSHARKAFIGVDWLQSLHKGGLLSNEGGIWTPLGFELPLPVPMYGKIVSLEQSQKDIATARSRSQEGTQTERDIYDRFFGDVDVETMAFSAQEFVHGILESLMNEKPSSAPPGGSDTGTKRSTATQTEPSPIAKGPEISESIMERRLEKTPAETVALGSKDTVVSTTTSTEQTSHANGTVETIVTVEKVFADGTVSVTETRNMKTAPQNQGSRSAIHENDRNDGDSEEQRTDRGPIEDRTEARDPSSRRQNKGKGWFWN